MSYHQNMNIKKPYLKAPNNKKQMMLKKSQITKTK